MINCLRSLYLVEARGFAHLVALGVKLVMLRYMSVSTVISTDLMGLLRPDCFGEPRLALHIPSSLRAGQHRRC